MRLLIITRHPPLPDWDGAGAYLADLTAYLAAHGVEVEIAWSQPPGAWRRRLAVRVPPALAAICSLQLPGALALGRWRWMHWGSWRARALHLLRGAPGKDGNPVTSGAPKITGRFTPAADRWSALPSPRELKFFRERIAACKPDVVLANYCWLVPALEHVRARIAVLAHDVVSQRLGGAGRAPRHPLDPAHADGERALLARVQAVLAITAEDAAVFRRWLPHGEIAVVPKAIPTQSSARHPAPGRCIFVGGDNAPNREGLAWLLDRIWPEIRRLQPHATLHVFGAVAAPGAHPPAGVTLHGRVASLASAYESAAVALIPLLRGTGMKVKLVEAAGHGVPCVTTPAGLQGLDALRNDVAVASDPLLFAAATARLLAAPTTALELGRALQHRATAEFSPGRCYGAALAALFPDTAGKVEPALQPSPRLWPAGRAGLPCAVGKTCPEVRFHPNHPAVSVVLPVYNAAPYLRAAVLSILRQTWRDFELIAINDGSTDGSDRILDELARLDSRVSVHHRANAGLTAALNHGIGLARGEFLARMDADDESAPTRFSAQVAALRADPVLVALGSGITFMDADGHPVKAWPRPRDHAAIEDALLRGDGGAMIHPAVMFRTAAVRAAGGYRPAAGHVEDLDLFLRLARTGRLGNLPGSELRYRVHGASVNFTRNAGRHALKLAVLREAWEARGLPFDPAAIPDGFARYADLAAHHREWSVTALAYGARHVAVRHGWRTVWLRPFSRASWRALRYALTAPMPPARVPTS